MSNNKICVPIEDVLPGTLVFEKEHDKLAAFIRSTTPVQETLWAGSMVWIYANNKKGYSFRTLKWKNPVMRKDHRIRFISAVIITAYFDGRFVQHISNGKMNKRQAGREMKKFKRENNL